MGEGGGGAGGGRGGEDPAGQRLEQLRKESVPLYMSAIQFDLDLMPLTLKGPVATPPIQGYIQDGEYKETTLTYKVIYEDTEAYMKSLLARRRERKKTVEED